MPGQGSWSSSPPTVFPWRDSLGCPRMVAILLPHVVPSSSGKLKHKELVKKDLPASLKECFSPTVSCLSLGVYLLLTVNMGRKTKARSSTASKETSEGMRHYLQFIRTFLIYKVEVCSPINNILSSTASASLVQGTSPPFIILPRVSHILLTGQLDLDQVSTAINKPCISPLPASSLPLADYIPPPPSNSIEVCFTFPLFTLYLSTPRCNSYILTPTFHVIFILPTPRYFHTNSPLHYHHISVLTPHLTVFYTNTPHPPFINLTSPLPSLLNSFPLPLTQSITQEGTSHTLPLSPISARVERVRPIVIQVPHRPSPPFPSLFPHLTLPFTLTPPPSFPFSLPPLFPTIHTIPYSPLPSSPPSITRTPTISQFSPISPSSQALFPPISPQEPANSPPPGPGGYVSPYPSSEEDSLSEREKRKDPSPSSSSSPKVPPAPTPSPPPYIYTPLGFSYQPPKTLENVPPLPPLPPFLPPPLYLSFLIKFSLFFSLCSSFHAKYLSPPSSTSHCTCSLFPPQDKEAESPPRRKNHTIADNQEGEEEDDNYRPDSPTYSPISANYYPSEYSSDQEELDRAAALILQAEEDARAPLPPRVPTAPPPPAQSTPSVTPNGSLMDVSLASTMSSKFDTDLGDEDEEDEDRKYPCLSLKVNEKRNDTSYLAYILETRGRVSLPKKIVPIWAKSMSHQIGRAHV